MKSLFLCTLIMATALFAQSAPAADNRLFELRIYHAAPGKLDALNARFRNHTTRLFTKHGMTQLGYWVPMENPDNLLIYVLAYPDRPTREAAWKAFLADPDWIKAKADSETEGTLVAKVDQKFLKAADFSPALQASSGNAPRVFEMRTYTTTNSNLPGLLDRFRNHTVQLFAKHGMTNLFYWELQPDQPDADKTLLYLLAHSSKEAATASFAGFRKDPDWVAARTASEEKAGGSLTIPNGVQSLFLAPTDYSQTR